MIETRNPFTSTMPSTPITSLSNADEAFLLTNSREFGRLGTPKADRLPFVTLTYACSLDGMIAIAPGAPTALSGPESKSMTHYLRLKHDAILVGAGTAFADNPSLNCRYPGAGFTEQPRPVIVDPKGRFDVAGTAVSNLAEKGEGKEPWVISLNAKEHEGALTLVVDENQHRPGRMEWEKILAKLKAMGIESVMVEGGADVINELLTRPDLVDTVILTIAPKWLGQGLAVSPVTTTLGGQGVSRAGLEGPKSRQFGADVVVCGALKN